MKYVHPALVAASGCQLTLGMLRVRGLIGRDEKNVTQGGM